MKDGTMEVKIYDGLMHFVASCDVCGATDEPLLIEVHNAVMCPRCNCLQSIYICKACILEAYGLIEEDKCQKTDQS